MSRILLVDDEPRVLRALSAALELDHDIVTSESGDDAIKTIKTEGPFDAIISDELMPGMKGHDLINWCITNAPHSKCLMLTGLPITDELKSELTSVDEVTIFTKPWNLSDIKDAIPHIEPSNDLNAYSEKEQKDEEIKPQILVVEKSKRYQKLYAEYEENHHASIAFFDNTKALLSSAHQYPNLVKIVLDIDEKSQTGAQQIKSIRSQFPETKILATVPPSFALNNPNSESEFENTKVLIKPFFYPRLQKKLDGVATL